MKMASPAQMQPKVFFLFTPNRPVFILLYSVSGSPRPTKRDSKHAGLSAPHYSSESADVGRASVPAKKSRNAASATGFEGITGRIGFDKYGDRTGSVVVIYKVVEEKGKSRPG